MDTPGPNFAADQEAVLLEPMRRLYPTPGPDDGTPSNDPGTQVTRAVHAECVLAVIDPPDRYPYVHYIATSEPSCLLCFRLFEAWRRSHYLLRGVYLRGLTGRAPSMWATPDLFSVYQYLLLLPELWCNFAAAMDVMYQRRQSPSARERGRIAGGEKPETPEERVYRKKARIARELASIPMYERHGLRRMLIRLEDYEKLQQDPDSD
ncbi:hypothetical protein EXIGLDRAFT_776744 [Exidia glandulosa HHB12029]|uniref:Uncharacterized protein n=1 Tax=Exidia glandulosa HHB12029 TaxID=1314781 RepID=A0A165DD56_EXIGL|nr:hypothetical protein EXIGLDRAFT_776744 [Exidia glandulosa HHB12029]